MPRSIALFVLILVSLPIGFGAALFFSDERHHQNLPQISNAARKEARSTHWSVHYKSNTTTRLANRATRSSKSDRLQFAAKKPIEQELQPAFQDPSQTVLARSDVSPLEETRTEFIRFTSAPFPFEGRMPRKNKPFFNVTKSGRRAHRTFSGRVYYEDQTYSDSRVLVHLPKRFDPSKPAVMVLFFHGHGATLERDVGARQKLPEQILASGMNAVLVAPQFAVDARDSSAGKFWQTGGAKRFLDEAAEKLATLYGNGATRDVFAQMPVIMVGYSGGYVPLAWSLARGQVSERVKGVVLLDGLYGEFGKFASFIQKNKNAFFISAFAKSTRRGNGALKAILSKRNIAYKTDIDGRLTPGDVIFVDANRSHRNYVTRAWTDFPVADLLRRLGTPKLQDRPHQSGQVVSMR